MTLTLKSLADALTRALEVVMVLCLAVMLVMVFGNVILRLFFNTGIDLSEEIPRFAFVWMTFLGAIVGMRRRAHLGVDIVVRMLPALGRRVCLVISQVVMLVCCVYIVYGTWLQHDIIKGNASPVAQLSMLWVFGVSYITGSAIGLICLSNLLRLFTGQVSDDDLIDVHEEGMADAIEAEQEMAAHPLNGNPSGNAGGGAKP
jgi:TRAP-type transport system small permease protein